MKTEETSKSGPMSVLITGAAGYIGAIVTRALARDRRGIDKIVATDVQEVPGRAREPGVIYEVADVREPRVGELVAAHGTDVVVHLAAIVTPPEGSGRELAYSVDVDGTKNVLDACVAHGVGKVILTSSGAAYGYHADNPALLREDDALRGNKVFAYSHNKLLVEQMLARYRRDHPELGQLIFRPGTVLGRSVHNQITAIFERPVVVGLREADSPFCFIWDEDVAACIVEGVHTDKTGIFNMAGDGVMTLKQIARRLGKPFVPVPVSLMTAGLTALQRIGVAPYGPEQVIFLQYRPVLSNERLKREFGYHPRLSSRQVFELYLDEPV